MDVRRLLSGRLRNVTILGNTDECKHCGRQNLVRSLVGAGWSVQGAAGPDGAELIVTRHGATGTRRPTRITLDGRGALVVVEPMEPTA